MCGGGDPWKLAASQNFKGSEISSPLLPSGSIGLRKSSALSLVFGERRKLQIRLTAPGVLIQEVTVVKVTC